MFIVLIPDLVQIIPGNRIRVADQPLPELPKRVYAKPRKSCPEARRTASPSGR